MTTPDTPMLASLREQLTRNLLREACGRALFCPNCGEVLDAPRCVLLEWHDGIPDEQLGFAGMPRGKRLRDSLTVLCGEACGAYVRGALLSAGAALDAETHGRNLFPRPIPRRRARRNRRKA